MKLKLSILIQVALISGFFISILHGTPNNQPLPVFEISEADETSLLNGEIPIKRIEVEDETYLWGAVIIEAAPNDVWKVMSSCKEVVEMVPQIRVCKIKEKKGLKAVVYHKVKLTRLLPSLKYSFTADFRENKEIDFSFLEGDLKDLQGKWKILERSNAQRSWIILKIKLSPGKMIPQGLVNSKLEKHIPKVLTALKKRVMEATS